MLYREFLVRYPLSRVILSVRDRPDRWAKSYEQTIGRNYGIVKRAPFKYMPRWRLIGYMSKWQERLLGIDRDRHRNVDHESAVDAYNGWVEEVKATVPASRLLVHKPEDGWKPICDFLDIPTTYDPKAHQGAAVCPSLRGIPYPNTAKRRDTTDEEDRLERIANDWGFLLLGLLALVFPVTAGLYVCCYAIFVGNPLDMEDEGLKEL